MKMGMLWFDNDKTRTLVEKVERAATFYVEKYGTEPNCCCVNPAVQIAGVETNGVELRHRKETLIYDLWIGVSDDQLDV